MKTALLLLATGSKYEQYIQPLVDSAERFFPAHDTFIWSERTPDAAKVGSRVFAFHKEPLGYPNETLHRYHTFLTQEKLLREYDYLYYCDIDMLFVAPINGEEIFSDGITATLHPGYVGMRGTPERRPESTAFCNSNIAYYCGGFQGGNAKAYLDAARWMAANIDEDEKRSIVAEWHDESHWNRYLAANPPARTLTPDYCYPEDASEYYKNIWRAAGLEVEPKIIAITKRGGR